MCSMPIRAERSEGRQPFIGGAPCVGFVFFAFDRCTHAFLNDWIGHDNIRPRLLVRAAGRQAARAHGILDQVERYRFVTKMADRAALCERRKECSRRRYRSGRLQSIYRRRLHRRSGRKFKIGAQAFVFCKGLFRA